MKNPGLVGAAVATRTEMSSDPITKDAGRAYKADCRSLRYMRHFLPFVLYVTNGRFEPEMSHGIDPSHVARKAEPTFELPGAPITETAG